MFKREEGLLPLPEQGYNCTMLCDAHIHVTEGKEAAMLAHMDRIGIDKALRILQYTADFSYRKDPETNVVTIY